MAIGMGDIYLHEVSEEEADKINTGRVATPNPDGGELDSDGKPTGFDFSHKSVETGDEVALLVTRVNEDGSYNGILVSDGVNNLVPVSNVDGDNGDTEDTPEG